jgi:hypothetical protein
VVPVAVVLRLRVQMVEKVVVHQQVVPEDLEQAEAAAVRVSLPLLVAMAAAVSLLLKQINLLTLQQLVRLADTFYHKLFYIK